MGPPQLSVSLAFTEAVSVKLDSLFGRICLIFRSLNQVTLYCRKTIRVPK
jgi:hypothetical protein